MATSAIDTTVFMRWQLPSEYENQQGKERREELKADFRRHFSQERQQAKNRQQQQQQQQQQESKKPQAGRSQLRVAIAKQSLGDGKQATAASSDAESRLMSHANRLLSDASESERRVICRALRLSLAGCSGDSADRGVGDEEVQRRVKDWAKTAEPSERRVAAEFFQRLSGSSAADAGVRAKCGCVLSALGKVDRGRTKKQNQPANDSKDTGSPRLRHLRLLTPGTRSNRWQHTTWHHLPPMPETSRGNNWDSHYAKLQEPDTHYRIHPDWGWDAPQP